MGQRKFGSIRTIKRRHATYYEASYPNPIVGTKPTRYYSTFDHTLDGYAQATAWLKEQHALITVDKWIPPQTQKKLRHIPTLETYAKEWLHTRTRKDGTRLKETTRQKHWQHLTNHVLPTLGSIPIDEITTSMVLNWYTTYPPEHGLRTRHTCYTLLKAIMDTASTAPLDDRGTTLIDSNPCTFASNSPRVAHEPHIASVDELYTLSQNMGDKLALTVLIAGICGLREGEICGLQRCDIDTRKRTIKVRRAIVMQNNEQGVAQATVSTPKTQSSIRTVLYPATLDTAIDHHLTMYVAHDPTAWIFTNSKGEHMSVQTLKNTWNKAKKKANLNHMWFHDLRKTALTRMVEAGATVGEVMAQAGHTSIQVASLYQKHTSEHQNRVMSQLADSLQPTSADNTLEPTSVDQTIKRLQGQSLSTQDKELLIKLLLQ